MPKKCAKNTSKSSGNQKANKYFKSDESDGNEDKKAETMIGLRRSSRTSVSTLANTSKSKYFDDLEDEEMVGSDGDHENDTEFKPKTKRKANKAVNKKPIVKSVDPHVDSSSSDGDDWEEVKDNAMDDLEDYNPVIPSEGVEITVNKEVLKQKKKKGFDVNDYIRQRINRFKRDLQSDKHKTSLLLLISRAFYLNNSINDETVKAIALSVTINEFKAPKRLTIKFLNEFIDWFKDNVVLKPIESESNETMIETLCRCLEERTARNSNELNMTFISLMRSLRPNYIIRLCYALNPIDIKAVDLILTDKQNEVKSKSNNKPKVTTDEEKVPKKSKPKKPKIVVISDSESNEGIVTTERLELWAEVYVETDKKWISLELSNGLIDKPMEMALKSFPQLSYVIALDSEGYIREVTQRYSDEWMSVAMKNRRTDQNWWTQTLKPFERQVLNNAEKAEDIEFEQKMASTPLPTKVGDYKNHPLYVLKKDLLKFQGIYPSDAPPLGFFRGEPVYARECVQLLRSRETWLRFARTVKDGETPYKCVKSRPKWDKYAKVLRKDLPLDVYGEWQTVPYEPPQARDGKVPRNTFGNVDLYQPSMLPKGCVHIQLPGLLRVANKLNIDCAPAIVAFDNNCGGFGAHPVMDGYIVCEEYKRTLLEAWDEEQENIRKREIEKKEKRVLDNWKKLIKGLLIRENLKKKYSNREEDSEETDIESDN